MEKGTSKRKRPHQVRLGDLGIYVFESRHSPDFQMDLLARDFHQLYTVREGQGFVETETEKTPIHENQIFYAPPHTAHRLVDDPADPVTGGGPPFFGPGVSPRCAGRSAEARA